MEVTEIYRFCLRLVIEETLCDFFEAGWASGGEYPIWAHIMNRPYPVGMPYISQERTEVLRYLVDKAQGWWMWDDILGSIVFYALADWEHHYQYHISQVHVTPQFFLRVVK